MAKILLVEDDNNLREIYQARLTAEGYEIVAAQNGEEALSVAKQARPDLIISDVMMPRISGFEMLDILRATPELASTKVIMLTALGQAEDQARAGKLGADKYLVKSQVTLEDIVNCAQDLLNGTSVITPSSSPVATTVSAEPIAAAPPVAVTATPATVTTANPAPVPEPPQPDPVLTTPSPVSNSVVTGVSTQASDNTAPIAATSGTPIEPVIAPVLDPDPIAEPAIPSVATDTGTSLPSIVTHSSGLVQSTEPTTEVASEATSSEPASTVSVSASSAQETQAPIIDAEPIQTTAPQNLASEEAVVASQIADFANSPIQTTQPETNPGIPAADSDTLANEETLNEAVQDLTDAINQPPIPELPPSQKPLPADAIPNTEPNPAESTAAETPTAVVSPETSPEMETTVTPSQVPVFATQTPEIADTATQTPEVVANDSSPFTEQEASAETQTPTIPESDQVSVAGKKVIKPINDITHGPNLDELLAKEVEKEQASVGLSGAVVSDESKQSPVTPAPQAAPAPPTNTTPTQNIDPNSIAL